MTVLSLSIPLAESLNVKMEKSDAPRCAYCGKSLPRRRKPSERRFCDEEHRKRWYVERLEQALQAK